MTHIFQGYITGTGTIIWSPNASEITVKDVGKTNQYQSKPKHSSVATLCLTHGKYSAVPL